MLNIPFWYVFRGGEGLKKSLYLMKLSLNKMIFFNVNMKKKVRPSLTGNNNNNYKIYSSSFRLPKQNNNNKY